MAKQTKGRGGDYVMFKKELAYQDWLNGMKLVDIAELRGIKIGTLKISLDYCLPVNMK